ncbi:MAG: hypothetical protein PUK86_13480, partial [bacterium]|nr:hypothetical protein [bacterium]
RSRRWGSQAQNPVGAFFSLPESAVPTINPQGILRIRRNQPLQSMAAGFVFCPAAASACRLSLSESAVPTINPQGILRIRRNQPLQSMAAGFVFCPAAASACRLSLQRPPLERFLFVFLTADLQPARFESTKVLYTDSMEK